MGPFVKNVGLRSGLGFVHSRRPWDDILSIKPNGPICAVTRPFCSIFSSVWHCDSLLLTINFFKYRFLLPWSPVENRFLQGAIIDFSLVKFFYRSLWYIHRILIINTYVHWFLYLQKEKCGNGWLVLLLLIRAEKKMVRYLLF